MKNTQSIKHAGNEPLEKSAIVCPVIGLCEIKKENYELKQQIGYWKKQHDRARIREEELKKDLALIEGKIKYLSHQLYGRKTEQDKSNRENDKSKGKKKKGQQKGNKIPKRRKYENLEEKEEVYDLPAESMVCHICKKPFSGLNSTDDSEVLEIQVKGYKRKIRKRKYIKGCKCNGGARIVTASGPGKIIPKGKIGVSIWAILLYEKYKLSIPMTRVLKKLSGFDLDIPKGTVGDGLKRLSSLFEPIYNELEKKSLESSWWQADETRWKVFVKIKSKKNYNWYLWVFISESSVVHIIDPTRSADVIEKHLGVIINGILLVDRYSAYKSFSNKREGILLGFCWAHVRRDFQDGAKKYPELKKWSLLWIKRIKKLYQINDLRVKYKEDTEDFKSQNKKLKKALWSMKTHYEKELNETELHVEKEKILISLKNHWEGLCVFVDNPQIPMDNNGCERVLRNPVVGRKCYYGSQAIWSARFTAVMLSIFETLELWGIDAKKWLDVYLSECASLNGLPPQDITSFLPWKIDKESFNKIKPFHYNPPKKSNKIYCGREFTESDMENIKQIIKENPNRKRTWISRVVCRKLNWYKPDGKLKDMSCRVALLKMERDGLIRLPPSQCSTSHNRKEIRYTNKTAYKEEIVTPVGELKELDFSIVTTRSDSILWNEYIDRYHYLGYTPLPGAQLRYFIKCEEQIIALMGFGASAWKVAPRDSFIGWTDEKRKMNLHLVVNQARFLILPWIKSRNLASKLLSIISRRIQKDWFEKYNYKPVLLETFVDKTKFSGACYKAANWKNVGLTKGRGKYDKNNKAPLPPKYIFLYPLQKNFRHLLA